MCSNKFISVYFLIYSNPFSNPFYYITHTFIYNNERYLVINMCTRLSLINSCFLCLKSTSDLTIKVQRKPIYVHKAILKIRSLYFQNDVPNLLGRKQSMVCFYKETYFCVNVSIYYIYSILYLFSYISTYFFTTS